MTDAIDINIPISPEMLHWGRRPTFEMVERIADGYASDVSRWLIGAHTGTHVDAPSHFVPGAATVYQIALESVVGPARVLDLRHVDEEITDEDLVAAGAEGAVRVSASVELRVRKSTRTAPSAPAATRCSSVISSSTWRRSSTRAGPTTLSSAIW